APQFRLSRRPMRSPDDQLGTVPEAQGRPLPPPEPEPVALPSHVGRYRVERLLGRGAFGLVYLAHDEQLQRLVALKVPHPHLVSRPEEVEAYLTEARIVAALDHPNLVPVYDVGSAPDCPFFVVSKFIEGSDLKKRLKDSPLSVTEAAGLVATVAET